MKRNIVMGLIFVLFVLIVGSYSLFFSAQRPIVQAENEAIAIAEDVAGIQKAEDFYWYNGTSDTYFTIGGYTEDGQYLYVAIKQSGGQVSIFNAQDIVTEEEAESILLATKESVEVLAAKMGIEADEPFWEVSYRDPNGQLGYLLISARTGETLKDYQNI